VSEVVKDVYTPQLDLLAFDTGGSFLFCKVGDSNNKPEKASQKLGFGIVKKFIRIHSVTTLYKGYGTCR
jgi:hypothetical protein